MARPIWKGHISFGLVNVPVTLYSAERRTDLQFRLLDSRNLARVRYERVNETTGDEVAWDDIVKGFEMEDGNYVLLSDEDFKQAKAEATQTVEIEGFVDRESINPMFFDKPYFLVPGKKGEKGYALLRETLREADKVGIARVVIRSREYLAALLVVGDALVLDLLRFDQELRDAEDFDLPGDDLEALKISDKELKVAHQLVDAMTTEWEPGIYHDEYREALLEWIRKKHEEGKSQTVAEPADEEAETEGGEVVDMMALLKKSLEAKGDGETKGAKKTGSKTSAASKKSAASSSKRRKTG